MATGSLCQYLDLRSEQQVQALTQVIQGSLKQIVYY